MTARYDSIDHSTKGMNEVRVQNPTKQRAMNADADSG